MTKARLRVVAKSVHLYDFCQKEGDCSFSRTKMTLKQARVYLFYLMLTSSMPGTLLSLIISDLSYKAPYTT